MPADKNDADIQVRFSGGHLSLCPPSWSEYEQWVNVRSESAQSLQPWEPIWDDKQFSRPSYRARLARFNALRRDKRLYPFHIFRHDDGQFVGAVTLSSIEYNVMCRAQLGYWIGDPYVGRGYARASVNAVVRYAFENLNLRRIEAGVQMANTRSIKVLEAVGFKAEGVARDYLKIDGVWTDHMIYAKTSTDPEVIL